MEAKRTPLIELLERVPRDAVLVVEHDQFSSSSYPVGRLCHEAAAALEAALVDAERYRLLRKGAVEDVAVVRGLGAMDYGMSAVVSTYSEEIDGDDLDAAIDAAMQRAGEEALRKMFGGGDVR